MSLDYENKDVSYHFGRLLAVLEKAERSTYDREEKREPNAMRLQSTFFNRPMTTWLTLEKALNPYYSKMSPGSRNYYKSIISSIAETITELDDGNLNRPLGEMYLMGYYLQRKELNKNSNKNIKEEEEK